MLPVENTRVSEFVPLPTPADLKERLLAPTDIVARVHSYREELRALLAGRDKRLLCIVGPCSIHDVRAAVVYAERLARLREELKDRISIVMRVYFEKPRTTVGWKGLVNDPHLDGTHDIRTGLARARELLLAIAALDLPAATEFLDPIVPQYLADLVSWVAIGARTTESQTHRELASGLSMPVGFKNATDGDLQVALDAMVSARHPHHFLGIDNRGVTSIVKTKGNPDVHIILRGGTRGTNYGSEHVAECVSRLRAHDDARLVLIDCSHGNSSKDHRRQPHVFREVLAQVKAGQTALLGMMLESHLREGRQDVGAKPLEEGLSITDACISWEDTEALLRDTYRELG